MFSVLKGLDIYFFYLINSNFRNIIFDWLMPIMSNEKLFFIPIALLITGCLILIKGAKFRFIIVGLFLLIGFSDYFNSIIIKPVIGRPRPKHSLSRVHLHAVKGWYVTPELKKKIYGKSISMPSSHATNMFAVAIFLSCYFLKLSPVFYLLAFLVGYSRIYLGVHYPFDVIVGSLTGSVYGLLFVWLNNRAFSFFEKKYNNKITSDS